MRILKTEEDSRGLKTRDHVGQLDVRIQVFEDLAKNTDGPKRSRAPQPPEGLDLNAVAHLERELVHVNSYFEGQIRTLGHKCGCPDGSTAGETPQAEGSSPHGPR